MTEYFDEQSGTWDQHRYRVERARIVAGRIKEAVPLTKDSDVLDFGCGTGLLGLNLTGDAGSVTLADSSEGMIEQVRNKIVSQNIANAVSCLVTDGIIPGSYDLIVSLMVLHHIEDTASQIRVLTDLLKPGGYICLCDLDSEDGSFHQDGTIPHNGFDRGYIEELLSRNGLEPAGSSTVFVNRKPVDGREMEYPVFMVTAFRKA